MLLNSQLPIMIHWQKQKFKERMNFSSLKTFRMMCGIFSKDLVWKIKRDIECSKKAFFCSQHNSDLNKTQGQKQKVTEKQIYKADSILQDCDLQLEEKRLTWKQLGTEIGADVTSLTMHKTMQATLDYEKFIACAKKWLGEKPIERRVNYASTMLRKYPEPKDWDCVRFNDEVHFGYGPESKLHIIQKPKTCYCQDCLQYSDFFLEKNRKQKHCWAAVGYNFKSDIIFYEIPSNFNGKISYQVYVDSIFESIIKL